MTVASAEAMVSADTIRTGALDSLKDSMHTPHIAQRGLKFNIPLDLRTPSYSDNSHSAQANIPEMWSVEFWRRVMQMAKDRGVDVYWFTWNTFLHSEEGKHGLSRAKPDENLARYFRASVRETVKTYPLLAGMGITAGEYMGEGLEPESPRQLVMQKQWFSFMLWGRLSYDPTLPDDLFKRTLAARFPEVPAANLRRHAEAAKRTVAELRPKQGTNKELRLTLGDIEAFACLGFYYAAKIEGACELALFDANSKAAHQAAAIKHLEAALGHWREYAAAYTKQYQQPLLYNRVGIVDIPKLAEKAAADIEIARTWKPGSIGKAPARKVGGSKFGQ